MAESSHLGLGVAKRAGLPVLALGCVVAAVLLANPTGDEEKPKQETADDVTAEQFCAAYDEWDAAHRSWVQTPSQSYRSALDDSTSRMSKLGAALEGVPADARAGLDYVVGVIGALPEVATYDDVVAVNRTASVGDTANAAALADFVTDTCA
jgi:hypothetical protein